MQIQIHFCILTIEDFSITPSMFKEVIIRLNKRHIAICPIFTLSSEKYFERIDQSEEAKKKMRT